MSLMKKLFGATPVGAGVGIVKDVAETAADIVERWAPGDEKRAQMLVDVTDALNRSAAAAREHNPGQGGPALWDRIIDGIARMIRPGVTIALFGGVCGWWGLPTTGEVDPVVLAWAENVLLFWFGGRAIFKDLPGVIQYLVEIRNLWQPQK